MKQKKRNGRITAIANQKGGVGKTTTAHALVVGLIQKGYKALAVDIDPQGNLTYCMGVEQDAIGTYHLLSGEADAPAAIQNTEQGDIIPGSLMLAGADLEFSNTGREYLLKEILDPLRADYDYIIIDNPPTLGILTINALTAADDLIIPLGADAFSMLGFSQLFMAIGKVKKHFNHNLNIAGMLITRYNGRTAIGRDMKTTIEKRARSVKARVFKSIIREGVAIREAQLEQRNLFSAGKSNVAADYLAFVDEYLKGAAK